MELPVFIIDSSHVPVPTELFSLRISGSFAQYFEMLNFLISSDTGMSEIPKVALGICVPMASPLIVMMDPEKALDMVNPIGVVCSLRSVSPSSPEDPLKDFTVELLVESVLQFNEFKSNSVPEKKSLWCIGDWPYIDDDLDKPFLEIDVESLCNVVMLNNLKCPEEVKVELSTATDIYKKIFILGNHFLQDSHERLLCISSFDNRERWDLISSIVSQYFSEERHTNEEEAPTSTRKSEGSPVPIDSKIDLVKSYQTQLAALVLPEETKAAIATEIKRLTHVTNQEASALRDYLTWTFSLKYNTYTRQPIELPKLISKMDETHYGLPDVKSYLLEHMVIEDIKGKATGSVLCFIGPPGTGKSSIAKTLASAGGRHFERISLGGVTDESEIRGHRRTFVASRPGRIINALRNAKSFDPLILLDEIDKTDSFKSNVSSALLEVLDPEQNDSFVDRYLEFPIDLSKTMFVCTANDENTIPEPLKDRMEIIRFRSYLKSEREVILREHLIPKIIKDYNIHSMDIKFSDEVLHYLTENVYIRQIEKQTARLLRMAATQIHVYGKSNQLIDLSFAESIIGKKTSRTLGFRT